MFENDKASLPALLSATFKHFGKLVVEICINIDKDISRKCSEMYPEIRPGMRPTFSIIPYIFVFIWELIFIIFETIRFFRIQYLDTKRLVAPPGSLAKKILSLLFSKKAFTNVFAQAIVDMREEYAEALADKKYWKARWIIIRDHIGLGVTVAAYIGSTVVKRAVGIWKMIP